MSNPKILHLKISLLFQIQVFLLLQWKLNSFYKTKGVVILCKKNDRDFKLSCNFFFVYIREMLYR